MADPLYNQSYRHFDILENLLSVRLASFTELTTKQAKNTCQGNGNVKVVLMTVSS